MSLLEKASLIMTPNAVKASKLYSIVPSTGNGDMDVVRATTATRVNSLGLIENVASNVARLNYEGNCPSLLLEPQRTNLFLRSEEFDNTYWGKTNLNINANSTIAPDGNLTADKFFANTTVGAHYFSNINVSYIQGIAYTFSFYAKKAESDILSIQLNNISIFPNNGTHTFNLTNGTFTPSGVQISGTISNVGNDWYRCTLTATAIGNGTCQLRGYITDLNDGISGLYLWGAQLEQGAYTTSYIPTVASTVTRNADVISKTGISDLIGQTEGVLFIESAALSNDLTQRTISISDGTSANRLYLYYSTNSNAVSVFGQSNGIGFSTVITYFLSDTTQFAKIAIRYNSTNISLWVNGVKRGTDLTSQALPINLSRFGFDSGSGGSNFYAKTKQVQLYKTYLTDTEMANLTTL